MVMQLSVADKQSSFDLDVDLSAVNSVVEDLAVNGSLEGLGIVYTKSEVVEFILDLCKYDVGIPLYKKRLLEPSFGGGDFLLLIIGRLLDSWRNHSKTGNSKELEGSIVAVSYT